MALRPDTTPRWRKSTWSGSGNCVEAAALPGAVLMRDTKAGRSGPVLRVAPEAWASFVAAAKGGTFTR